MNEAGTLSVVSQRHVISPEGSPDALRADQAIPVADLMHLYPPLCSLSFPLQTFTLTLSKLWSHAPLARSTRFETKGLKIFYSRFARQRGSGRGCGTQPRWRGLQMGREIVDARAERWSFPAWDVIVVCASDSTAAEVCYDLLLERQIDGLFDQRTLMLIAQDPYPQVIPRSTPYHTAVLSVPSMAVCG